MRKRPLEGIEFGFYGRNNDVAELDDTNTIQVSLVMTDGHEEFLLDMPLNSSNDLRQFGQVFIEMHFQVRLATGNYMTDWGQPLDYQQVFIMEDNSFRAAKPETMFDDVISQSANHLVALVNVDTQSAA
ncbi:hypothetical protein C1J03_13425 [Sulfitobacter sp. SK012]|uniref:hypothetical protein n=1 Tax=Sulfitobacter sp. SK012 TaxID=1389005 RepID=UPI000E0C00AA|nr:hypothetical protein [Sulfitobacter sp. SK012]AXI46932.1 hypothetical protein C1J03_13425 [Sulfitobacter sp. SK012]